MKLFQKELNPLEMDEDWNHFQQQMDLNIPDSLDLNEICE
jgi:hypothetical protein